MFERKTELSKILKNMKNRKSTGEGVTNNEMLTCCSPIIDHHIATLFNNCIEKGIFPDCFITAEVIPLYKRVIAKTLENTNQSVFYIH